MKREIVYFMVDRADAGTIKRARSLNAIGFHVIGFSYHRHRYTPNRQAEWENVDLGVVADQSYVRRLSNLLRGLLLGWKMRRRLREVPYFLARGLDLCLLALAVRWLVGGRQRVIYEVYDIHFTLLERTWRGALFRWLERRILARVATVVITAPAYLTEYFIKWQGYRGPHHVVENKLPAEVLGKIGSPPLPAPWKKGERPLVIGWFGALRCSESLEILRRAALALPDELTVHLRGWPSEIPRATFDEAVASAANMHYYGPFESPEDLAAIYGKLDVNWAIDLQYRGGNSDWLLPFRIYEGGYCNVPALGAAGVATGVKVEELDLGWALDEPYVDSLIGFVRNLEPAALEATRTRLQSMPRTLFAGDDELAALFAALDRHAVASPARTGADRPAAQS